MIEPVLGGDIIFIQTDIIGAAGLVIGVIMSDYFERVQVKVEQQEEKERGGENQQFTYE